VRAGPGRAGRLSPCGAIIDLAVSVERTARSGRCFGRTPCRIGADDRVPRAFGGAIEERAMVASIRPETEETTGNPLDLVEQVAIANEWPFQRQNDDELAAEISGHWCQYRMWFCWHPDLGVMHLSCALEMKVPANKREAIYALLALANEKLWLGHFDLWSEENLPVFRHAVLLREGISVSSELMEDLVDIAVTECERFYPAFQFVIWGGKSPLEALTAAMLETEGEA
jgi:hypothetical protein